MKVKIFRDEAGHTNLEALINNWLQENDIKVKHIKQNYVCDIESKSFITLISVWYEEKK